MESSVKASMEDLEELKAPTDVTFTGSCTKASTDVPSTKSFMEVSVQIFEALAEDMETVI